MDLQQNPKIRQAIDLHLATGKYSSDEEVLLVALNHLSMEEAEAEATLASLQRSIADEKAGRMKPLADVADGIRRKHGFNSHV